MSKKKIKKNALFVQGLIAVSFALIALGSASSNQSSPSGGGYSSPSSSGYSPPPLEHTDFPDVACDGCRGKGYYTLLGVQYTCKTCNGTGKKPK
jgi:DnaJ-class molecular chaperone